MKENLKQLISTSPANFNAAAKKEILRQNQQSLNLFWLLAWLTTCYFVSLLPQSEVYNALRGSLFTYMVIPTYAGIYLLPGIILSKLSYYRGVKKIAFKFIIAFSIIYASLLNFIIFCDSRLFSLYGFHINGFVINLITTPGGIDSLDQSSSATLSMAAYFLGILIFCALLGFFSTKIFKGTQSFFIFTRKYYFYKVLIILLIFLSLSERVIYGFSKLDLNQGVLESASSIPLYQPLTFRSLATKVGLQFKKENRVKLHIADSKSSLNYPLNKLVSQPPKKALNIIILVAESLRFDMLDPEIMPKTFSFAKKAQYFTQHYSGGNGTREGLCSLFYGVYGSYWDSFLAHKVSPILMDELIRQNYYIQAYTSASFTYPEFDQTIFKKIPPDNLHRVKSGEAWERDVANVTHLIENIEKGPKNGNFFSFMFFEATHARYSFPAKNIIRPQYARDINYATLSKDELKKDIRSLKNRYINASNFIDSQFGRIISYLENKNLLNDTILLITGDHGEEFMENGNWGHNINFSEEQVRVPFVFWLPGKSSEKHDYISSHLDFVPTIMPLLGIENPINDYSLGSSLFDESRSYVVVSSYSSLGIINQKYKYYIPIKNRINLFSTLTNKNDSKIRSSKLFLNSYKNDILEVTKNIRRFIAPLL